MDEKDTMLEEERLGKRLLQQSMREIMIRGLVSWQWGWKRVEGSWKYL